MNNIKIYGLIHPSNKVRTGIEQFAFDGVVSMGRPFQWDIGWFTIECWAIRKLTR